MVAHIRELMNIMTLTVIFIYIGGLLLYAYFGYKDWKEEKKNEGL